MTYNFVEFTAEIQSKLKSLDEGKSTEVKLCQDAPVLPDMDIKPQEIGPYILNKTRIKHENKYLFLKDINPGIVPVILKLLKPMLLVWGKTVFENFVFTFNWFCIKIKSFLIIYHWF